MTSGMAGKSWAIGTFERMSGIPAPLRIGELDGRHQVAEGFDGNNIDKKSKQLLAVPFFDRSREFQRGGRFPENRDGRASFLHDSIVVPTRASRLLQDGGRLRFVQTEIV